MRESSSEKNQQLPLSLILDSEANLIPEHRSVSRRLPEMVIYQASETLLHGNEQVGKNIAKKQFAIDQIRKRAMTAKK
jgi:hypothetical protein